MLSKVFLIALAGFAVSHVAADPASPLAIETVKQQFINALITPAVVPVFDPSALLNVSFTGSVGSITTGQAVSKDNAGVQPNITIVGTAADFATGGSLNSSTKYTIIMIDGDYAGANDTAGVNTHYLQNDLTYGQMSNDVLTLASNSTPVIAYAGPGPAAGSGPHRYILLAYAQPSTFAPPATPAAGSSVTMIDFLTYIKTANLGSPLAGNYFTVEVGNSTVSVSATSAVNTATLAVASSSGTGTTTGTAATASSTEKKSGAIAIGANGLLGGVVAMIMIAICA